MSRNKQRIGLMILLAAVAGAVGWNLWSGWLGNANGGGLEVDVLCAKCGYSGRAESSQLSKTGGAARAPAFGPGYACPKCGQRSLYANPIVCEGCRTPYLVTLDANGAVQAKCTKCGRAP